MQRMMQCCGLECVARPRAKGSPFPRCFARHAALPWSLQAVKKQAKGWLAGLRDKLRSPTMLRHSHSGLSRASASNVGSLLRSVSGTSWNLGSVNSGGSRPGSAAPGGLLARAFRRKKQDSSLSEDSLLAAAREGPPASRGTTSSEISRRAAASQGNRVAPGPVGEGREEQQLLQQRGQQEQCQGQGRGRGWRRWLGLGGRQAPVFDPSGLPHGMEWASELDAAELEEVAQVGAWLRLAVPCNLGNWVVCRGCHSHCCSEPQVPPCCRCTT
jgi:hypothetical protein